MTGAVNPSGSHPCVVMQVIYIPDTHRWSLFLRLFQQASLPRLIRVHSAKFHPNLLFLIKILCLSTFLAVPCCRLHVWEFPFRLWWCLLGGDIAIIHRWNRTLPSFAARFALSPIVWPAESASDCRAKHGHCCWNVCLFLRFLILCMCIHMYICGIYVCLHVCIYMFVCVCVCDTVCACMYMFLKIYSEPLKYPLSSALARL